MEKLDLKRKVVLGLVILVLIICGFMGQPKSAETVSVAVAATPAVQQAPVTPAAVVTSAATVTSTISPNAEVKQESKFYVYQDNVLMNHYVLSGFMPEGKCIEVNDSWRDNCKEGQKCLKISYDTQCSKNDQGWAGIYWLEPANNWGESPGGYNLTGKEKLVFWALGEKGGEVISTFKMGGITGAQHKFSDSDTASIGPVTLTSNWQQYSIDLKGKDLSHIVGGFAWAANVDSNPEPIMFYLDDIHFE